MFGSESAGGFGDLLLLLWEDGSKLNDLLLLYVDGLLMRVDLGWLLKDSFIEWGDLLFQYNDFL